MVRLIIEGIFWGLFAGASLFWVRNPNPVLGWHGIEVKGGEEGMWHYYLVSGILAMVEWYVPCLAFLFEIMTSVSCIHFIPAS